jgi:hypothetical protein
MANNSIKLPIKTLDFDKFTKMFADEMKLTFDKFYKSSNYNKNVNTLMADLTSNLKKKNSKLSKKNLKDLHILKSILKERDVMDQVIHNRNKLFLKKLKKSGVKVSDEDTYKIAKKSIIKGLSAWKPRQYDLLKKGSKLFFSVNINLNVKHYGDSSKKITLLEDTNILDKVKFYKKLNSISFIPKIVEIVVLYKKGNIDGIKIISDYVKGMTLDDYLKKKKLTNAKQTDLKKNIMKKMDVLKQKGFKYGSWNMGQDIIIDNNHKIFFTGIKYLTEYAFNTNKSRLERVFNKEYYFKQVHTYEDLILHSLIKKNKLVFKK